MKLISLNTWGGVAGKEKLLAFFKRYQDVDIFCLQEIWSAPYKHLEGKVAGGKNLQNSQAMVYGMQEISTLLTNHVPYFRPHHLDNYGLLLLIKKDISVVSEGELYVYKEKGYVPEGDVGMHARNLQYVTISTPHGLRTIMNFHGLWNGKGKGDTKDRLEQSEKIIHFLKTIPHPFVLCGDFNLLPTTQSLKKIEELGLKNLITEYGITSTRTSYYTKKEKFADYALTSEKITVHDFKVLLDEISDHSPLYLEFE